MFFRYLEPILAPFRRARTKGVQAKQVYGNVKMDGRRVQHLGGRAARANDRIGEMRNKDAPEDSASGIKVVGLLKKRRVCDRCGFELHASWRACRFCEDKVPTYSEKAEQTLMDEVGESPRPDRLAWLVAVDEPNRGQVIQLESPTLLGTSSAAKIQLDDSFASQRHAELRNGPEGWTISDLGSTNGTSVNEKPLAPKSTEDLFDHDFIRVGRTSFLFKCL